MTMWMWASVPFWLLGAVLAAIALCGLAYAVFGPGMHASQSEFNRGVTGALICLLGAGAALYIAARVAS